MRTPLLASCLCIALAGVAPAADSLNVRLIGRCSMPKPFTFGVAVKGDYAYVADYDSGLRVVSVADPANPTEVGHYDTPGHADGVTVVGDLAYVSDGDSGLRVVSVTDPAHPVEVGNCGTPSWAREVAVAGEYAYVGDDTGLSVISVTDPAHPARVGRYDNQHGAFGVAVAGDYAYIGNSQGLWVISIADPTQPVEVGRSYAAGGNGVAVNGDYAYLAGGFAGLRVISIADPTQPVEVGYWPDSNGIIRLAVSGSYVYAVPGLNADGLRVISVAEPMQPVEVGYHYYGANCVAVGEGYVYACSGAALSILQFYGGGVEETSSAQVRTKNSMPTVVRGVLVLGAVGSRQNAGYRAELLDAAGRQVVDLHLGANDVSRLSPGVHFIHDAQTQAQAVRKVIISR